MHFRHAASGLLALAAAALLAAPAHAQLFRTYLSASGSDANACTLAAPCRLLPAALGAVADGGEIWILDSANYNSAPVSVAKSVSILAVPGVVGSIVAVNGDAIDVATAGVNLALRNLVIVPSPNGTATNGINVTAGASLVVENCLIANLPGAGILVSPTTSIKVRVSDSTVRGNGLGGGTPYGVQLQASTAGTSSMLDISNSNIDGNFAGVLVSSGNATASIKAAIHDSRIRQGTDNGIAVAGNGTVAVDVSHNIVSNNGLNGVISISNGKIWASGNTVTNNGTGLRAGTGGVVESAGNNEVRNNAGGDSVGTITTVPRI